MGVMPPARPRFRKYFGMVLLLSIFSAFVAVACSTGSDDTGMFDKRGESMDESEAAAAKAGAEEPMSEEQCLGPSMTPPAAPFSNMLPGGKSYC